MPANKKVGCVIVIGQNLWGKDRNGDVEKARKFAGIDGRGRYLVYECEDPEAVVNEMGDIGCDAGTKVELVGKYAGGKKV